MEHWLDRLARALGARHLPQGNTGAGPLPLERISVAIAGSGGNSGFTRRAALKFASGMAVTLGPAACVQGAGVGYREPPPQLGLLASPCGDDTPTPESLEAAKAALSGGATDVALSPRGCLRYRRTLAGDQVSADELVAGDKVVSRATYSNTASSAETDFDYDGVPEERTTYRRIPGPGGVEIEEVLIEEFAPDSGRLIARQQRTRRSDAPDTVKIVHEEVDQAGELIRREWNTGPDQLSQHIPNASARTRAAQPCTPQQIAAYRQALGRCISEGARCLKNHGAPVTAEQMGKFAAVVEFECDPNMGGLAAAAKDAWNPLSWRPGGTRTITINPTIIDPLSAADQAAVMCHELLHYTQGIFSVHDPALNTASQQQRNTIDPLHACGELCFGSTLGTSPTKCHCARCLRTNICAPACASYADCDPNLGAICGCPCRYRYYESRSVCEAECSSGLCCFPFRCFAIDVSCP